VLFLAAVSLTLGLAFYFLLRLGVVMPFGRVSPPGARPLRGPIEQYHMKVGPYPPEGLAPPLDHYHRHEKKSPGDEGVPPDAPSYERDDGGGGTVPAPHRPTSLPVAILKQLPSQVAGLTPGMTNDELWSALGLPERRGLHTKTKDAKSRHMWRQIRYPRVPAPWDEDQTIAFHVGSGQRDVEPKFRVDVLWSTGPNGSARSKSPTPSEQIVVRLHRADGTVVKSSSAHPPMWSGLGSSLGTTLSLIYAFPWGPNTLEEAWVECRFPRRKYWLEVPYGFTRNPKAALAPSIPTVRGPSLAAAMDRLETTDRIVPWLSVEYDLGVIQNNWRLSLKQSNPFDARCEVVLYRDDRRGSMYLWGLHTPRTSVVIEEPGGYPLRSTCMSIRNHEDGMRRSDKFNFLRYPHSGRTWGVLTVSVDDEAYQTIVPSSLFRYCHGTTARDHKQCVPLDQ